jgi:hypothetical protein
MSIDTDTNQLRLRRAASCRSSSRYVAWEQFGQSQHPRPPARAPEFASLVGGSLAVSVRGALARWHALVTSQATAGQLRRKCVGYKPCRLTSCSLRATTPPVPGIHLMRTTTAAHNTPVNADAELAPV